MLHAPMPSWAAEDGARPARHAAAAGPITIRPGTPADAPTLFALITANLEVGHLLPRTLPDLVERAHRFLVLVDGSAIVGCGEVAPLSRTVAEIRSLVVDERYRGRGLGSRLVDALKRRARIDEFQTLCAFTHQPTRFVGHGFSIVPHQWLPEKIAHDCRACPLFRQCGQYAMWFSLNPAGAARPASAGATATLPAAVLPGGFRS
jgi:amino-acid N-acetyltransferase